MTTTIVQVRETRRVWGMVIKADPPPEVSPFNLAGLPAELKLKIFEYITGGKEIRPTPIRRRAKPLQATVDAVNLMEAGGRIGLQMQYFVLHLCKFTLTSLLNLRDLLNYVSFDDCTALKLHRIEHLKLELNYDDFCELAKYRHPMLEQYIKPSARLNWAPFKKNIASMTLLRSVEVVVPGIKYWVSDEQLGDIVGVRKRLSDGIANMERAASRGLGRVPFSVKVKRVVTLLPLESEDDGSKRLTIH